jgi:hypothetical protein
MRVPAKTARERLFSGLLGYKSGPKPLFWPLHEAATVPLRDT